MASGVRRLVLLSGRGEVPTARSEQAVGRAGADWTIVRSSFFAQNFSEDFLTDAVRDGVVAFPAGEVAEPFIDVGDIADVAVAALTDPRHAGQVYEVTGPRLLTFADAVAEIAAATSREVSYVPVIPQDFTSRMVEAGLPDEFATQLTGLFTEVLDGGNAYVTDGVQRAVGCGPRDFADYARAAAATGAGRRLPTMRLGAPGDGRAAESPPTTCRQATRLSLLARTAPFYRVAEMTYESVEALRSGLGSEEGQAVLADLANFATGEVTMPISESD